MYAQNVGTINSGFPVAGIAFDGAPRESGGPGTTDCCFYPTANLHPEYAKSAWGIEKAGEVKGISDIASCEDATGNGMEWLAC
jgi:hypothetical protein